MFEKFLSANAADFRQRYQGTYGFFKNVNAKLMLCRLTFVEGVVTFVDKRGGEYTLFPDKQEDVGFYFLPPKAGYFNIDEGAVYVERVAARQFSRGVSDRTTKLYLIGKDGFKTVPTAFKYLEKVYDGNVPLKDALENYLSGKTFSLAVGSQFAFHTGASGERSVYVFGTKVGSVVSADKEVIRIKLDEPELFRTELNDALKAHVKLEVV